MSNVYKSGSVDQYTECKLWTVADGLPKTDAVFNTTGLSIKYQVDNGAIVSVTVAGSPAPATMSAGGSHADWGIYHVGNGWYKIGLADAVLATAGTRVRVWIELADCDSGPTDIYVGGYDGSVIALGASVAGDEMDLVDAPNPTAVTALRANVADVAPTAAVADVAPTADVAAVASSANTAAVADVAPTAAVAAVADVAAVAPTADVADVADVAAVASSATAVAVASFTAAALLQLVTDDTGRTTAVDGSVGRIAQGSAADITDELATIIGQTSLISGARLNIVSPVYVGGDIRLTKGFDFLTRRETAVEVLVLNGNVAAELQDAAKVASVIFGAGTGDRAAQIIGTVDIATIRAVEGITYIPVEFPREALDAAPCSLDYVYHLASVAPIATGETAGDVTPIAIGSLELQNDRLPV